MELDRELFHLINSVYTFPFLDSFMTIITNEKLWVPFLFIGWLFMFFGMNGRKRELAVLVLATVILSDLVSARIMKKIVNRRRPCCVETDARKLIGCKGSKSHPSSHAANTAAIAGAVIFEEGIIYGLPLLAVSFIVAYSRIYVGVHYPLDVIGGIALGLVIGWLAVKIKRRFHPPQSTTPY